MVQFYGSIFNEATANTGVACPSHSRAMLRLGGRHAPVSPFSLHGPADVVQPAPSFATNSFSSADSPLSRWFSDQLAEVAASAHLDQHAQPSHQQQQQPLQHLPRSLSSKQFSARYGRWADGVIEDMMTSPGSLADRSNSSSLRSEYGGAAGSHAPSPADSGMLPALSISRAELATLSGASNGTGDSAAFTRARRPSLPPTLLRTGATVGSPLNPVGSSVASSDALEATARRLSLPPAYYSVASQARRNGREAMDQT